MKAIHVEADKGYKIRVTFDDGICGTVDLSDTVQKGVFTALQQGNAFRNVTTDGYSISWSDELEIDAANIYAEITGTEPKSILYTSPYHAAD